MTTKHANGSLSKPTLVPLASTTKNAGAPKCGKANPVLKRKKPGLKLGQTIRRARKLRPAQIQSIARAIRERAMQSPGRPYTYAELEGEYEVSAVTLRSKPAIRMAVEETRAAALVAKQETEKACANAAASDEGLSNAKLRKEVKQLTQEIENYRVYFQRLALMYRKRGEQMPQIVEEAECLATGKPMKPRQASKEATDAVAPIFRQ